MMEKTLISDTDRYTGKQAWLDKDAAAGYESMKKYGMPGGCVSSAGRTEAEQLKLYNDMLAGKIKSASKPNTPQAKHQYGRAIDLNEPARSWCRANGQEFGFVKDLVKGELWHMEYIHALNMHSKDVFTEVQAKELVMSGVQLSDVIGLLRCNTGAVISVNLVTGKVKGVTLSAFNTLGNAGVLPSLYFDDGAGKDLDNMDQGPFNALVDLLS